MRIDRISYKKIFPLGSYVNETIGMEAQIDDGEDVQAKMLTLKNLVEDFHKRNNPCLHVEMNPEYPTGIPVVQDVYQTSSIPSIDRKAIERLEILIDNAVNIDELSKYREDAIKYGIGTQFAIKAAQLLSPK